MIVKTKSGAFFSPCRTWRYSLTRKAAPDGVGTVAFIGLNPSTADERLDDPTIRRCIRFARDWNFARLKMLNLYAYRDRHPQGLAGIPDPVGPENDRIISKVIAQSSLVVCAWGAWGGISQERVEQVVNMIVAPHCLGVTQSGAPRHPLYMRADTLPQPYAHCPYWRAWKPRSHDA